MRQRAVAAATGASVRLHVDFIALYSYRFRARWMQSGDGFVDSFLIVVRTVTPTCTPARHFFGAGTRASAMPSRLFDL